MPDPFDPAEETTIARSPFDPEPRTRPQRQVASADGGFRDPKQPGYTFFPTGHVVRDADKKVWDPSTKSWYFMTEHGMSPEYGKASIPEQDDTRLDTLNLLRKIGSPVIPSKPQTQTAPQPEGPSVSALSPQEARAMRRAKPLEQQMGEEARYQQAQAKYGKLPYWLNTALQVPLGMAEMTPLGLVHQGLKALPKATKLAGDIVGALGATETAEKIRQEGGEMERRLEPSYAYQQLAPRDAVGGGLRALGAFASGAGAAKGVLKTAEAAGEAFHKVAPMVFGAHAGLESYEQAKEEGATTGQALTKGTVTGAITAWGMKRAPGLAGKPKSPLGAYARMAAVAAGGGLGQTVAENGIGKILYNSKAGWLDGAAENTMFWGMMAGSRAKGLVEQSRVYKEAKSHPEGVQGYMADKAIESGILMDKAFTGESDASGRPVLDMDRLSPEEKQTLDKNQSTIALLSDYALKGKKKVSPEERLAAVKEREKALAESQAQEDEADKPKPEAFSEAQPEEIQPRLPRETPAGEEVRPLEGGEGVAPSEEYARFSKELDDLDKGLYAPTSATEGPLPEARTSQERRIAEEPVDIERRAIERRQETKKSIEAEKRPEEMTQAELAEEVGRLRSERMLDSKVTDMANERAFNATYQEGDPVASLDVRGLKATNKFGQHVGDEFLIDVFSRLNKIAKEEGAFAAHRSGDEGLVTHSDPAVLNRVIERTNQDLLKNPFTFVDERTGKETKINGEFHYGTATSPEAADRAMAAAKVAKAQPPVQPATPGRTEGVAPAISGREPVPEPGISYLNSGLNIQHAIADVLGMKRGSTWSEMAPVAMEKIGKLGASVRETAVKIVNTFKGITREAADILAKSLHESFSGSRESQMGAVGKEVSLEVKAARDQQRAEREAIKASDMTKEERREAYKSITKMDALLRNGQAPADTAEATRVAYMAASKTLPKGEKAAAQVKLAEGMKVGTFPQFSDMKLKADGTPDMGSFLQSLQAAFTGDGVMNPDGSKVVIAPMIEHDAAKTAESVRMDLSRIERMAGRIGSTSHVYTGTWSLGVSGEKGAKTIGALEGVNNPATDKHLGTASAFGNTVHVSQHLTDTLTKYSIPNNHFRLLKELKPTNEYWSKAVKEYNAAEESYIKNKSVTTERAFEIAKEKVADARKVVDSHLREIYSDPSYGDARVMAYADATRGGKAAPEWLESLMSKSEKGAALEITNQMNEIKRALSEAGIPVREDYGVPHTIKAWMKGTDFKRAYDPDTGKISPEALEFKHRSDQSVLTMPDAYGMVEDYIPHTMSLIAKRNVANKWDYVARELEATNPRLSEQIKQDMSSYTKGEGAVHEWMDKINSWFANYLVGYRTATAVKHLAKYPLELANASPIKSAMGWVEFKREVAKNPELKRIMDEMTRAAKGPRYNAYPDLGTGEDVTGVAKGVGQKISDSSHYPMQFVEGALRSNTFRMDLLGNIRKGMNPQTAVADAVFRSLMVNFQASDKPMIMRSSMGRSIFFLQQTVWKIMECNVRAATDAARGIKRGAETTFTGEKLSAEEKGRYSQAARQMAALVAMYYIGKQTNTKLFDWISESPSLIKAIITRPLMVMTKNAVAKAKGEETDWHYDPTEELMSGISATQAFQNVEKSAKEYGFGSKGFWLNLTPLALQDIALEPSKYQQQKTGTGAEALFRRVTGLTKMEEEEEAKEKMLKKTHKKQESKSEKLVQRLRNPLEVIAPAVQESETSPFDRE